MKTIRKAIIDALTLESRKTSVILGTIIPFFYCHLWAYDAVVKSSQSSKCPVRWRNNAFKWGAYLLLLLLAALGSSPFYALAWVVASFPETLIIKAMVVPLLLTIQCAMTCVYYLAIKPYPNKPIEHPTAANQQET